MSKKDGGSISKIFEGFFLDLFQPIRIQIKIRIETYISLETAMPVTYDILPSSSNSFLTSVSLIFCLKSPGASVDCLPISVSYSKYCLEISYLIT